MSRYFFDIETDGLLDDATVIHSLVLQDVDTGFVFTCCDHPYDPTNPGAIHWSIEDGLYALMSADEIIGHNIIKFDIPAIQKLYPWWKPTGKVTDTLVISRLIWTDLAEEDRIKRVRRGFPTKLVGSHSLKAWGYRLKVLKGEFGETTDWFEWSAEMQSYCEQDVVVTEALWRRSMLVAYSEEAIELEHEFATIIAMMERWGFAFNEIEAAKLYATLVTRRLEIATELKKAFPPKEVTETFIPKVNSKKLGYQKGVPFTKRWMVEFNPSSRQMIAARLMEFGWQPSEFTPSGQPKIDETILSKLPYPEAALLAEHFLVEKRIGQLAEGEQAWLKLVKKGRIHGSVNTNGAVTGRCTHSNPNVAQTPSVGAPYGAECRSLFTVRPGYSLVGADLAGLELRCLAHFMARYDGGEYGRVLLEGDIHWANVQALGLTNEARDEEHQPLHKLYRNGAKTFIYGFLYGAGDLKIGLIIYDIVVSAKKLGLPYQHLINTYFRGCENPTDEHLKAAGAKLKKSFLAKTPALRRLREDVKAAAQKRGYLSGLDGRRLNIRSDHAALNTLLQSAGALIAKKATIIAYHDLCRSGYVWGRDFALVAHVHDEMQLEVRAGLEDEVGRIVVEAMRKAGRYFNFRCPIDGEYKFGKNWKDTH